MIDFKKAEEEFEKYVLKFDLQNENIKMKKDHSYRVEKESYNIAKSLELNEEQVQIAKLVGLLHDIGRFEQITQYSTFVDSKSIDHAEYGVEQLNKNNLIILKLQFISYTTSISCSKLCFISDIIFSKYSLASTKVIVSFW